ncbi:MAG: CBS domain-containing protein [Gemmatimonadota bacterium]
MMGRNVEDVMRREVVTVTPDSTVRELLKCLVSSQISGVPVVTGDGEVVGVVSTTDVVRLGAGEKEISSGDMVWEPLVLPDEEYEVDSAAPFFMVSPDWRFPTESQTEALPEGVFDGFTVSDIMTPAVFTVKPKDTVEEVAKFLLRGRIHRALVVEDDQLKGIVTTFDLLRAFVED